MRLLELFVHIRIRLIASVPSFLTFFFTVVVTDFAVYNIEDILYGSVMLEEPSFKVLIKLEGRQQYRKRWKSDRSV